MRGPVAHFVGIALVVASAAATSALAGVAERYEDGLAAYQKNDFQRSLKALRPLADKGDARAQYLMGRIYQFGQGVKADRGEAYYWYKRAEAKGHLEAKLFRQLLEQRWKISAADKARAEQKLAAISAPAKSLAAVKSEARPKAEKTRTETAALRESIKPTPPKAVEPAKSEMIKSRPELPRTKPEATTEVAARIAPPEEESAPSREPRAEVVRPAPPRQPAHADDDERESAYAPNGPPAETRTPMPTAPEYTPPPQNYPPAYTQPAPYYSPAAPPSWGAIYANPGPGPYYAPPRWGYRPYAGYGYAAWRGYAGYRGGFRGRW